MSDATGVDITAEMVEMLPSTRMRRLIEENAALSARLEAVEAERDQWARMIGEIASQVPLSEVISATSTVGDLVQYLKGATSRAKAAENKLAQAVEALRHYSCNCAGDMCEGTGGCGDYARATLAALDA